MRKPGLIVIATLVAALMTPAAAWADNTATNTDTSNTNTAAKATNTAAKGNVSQTAATNTQNNAASNTSVTEKDAVKLPSGWSKDKLGKWRYANSKGQLVTGWLKDGAWYYLDPADEGRMAENKVMTIEGARYAFKASGAMATGWAKVGSSWYYANGSGALRTGWVSDGAWYYLDPADGGKMTESCIKSIDGHHYVFAASGAMATGWAKIGSEWYYASPAGILRTGWVSDGAWYYLNPAEGGKMAESCSMAIDGKLYAFTASGAMATGWAKVGSDWYYAYGSGALRTGWLQDGVWYYLDPANGGKMATGAFVATDKKKYCANKDGALITNKWVALTNGGVGYAHTDGAVILEGTKNSAGKIIVTDSKGDVRKGWISTAGLSFYADGNGALIMKPTEIDGMVRFFDSNGIAKEGWTKEGSSWYYVDPSTHAMAVGWKTISDAKYYFHESGKMAEGWLQLGEDWYWLTPSSGNMAKGFAYCGSRWYYFENDGKWVSTFKVSDNDELNRYVYDIICNKTGFNLRACFTHVRDNYHYIRGSVWPSYSGWQEDYAVKMVRNGGGNCYSYACLLHFLAKASGYNTAVISGQVPSLSGGLTPHGWVELYQGGRTYILDAELAREIHIDGYMETYSNPSINYVK